MTVAASRWVVRLGKVIDKGWATAALAFLALADLFILIIPTEGLLVSAVMLRPKRWFTIALWVTTGSAIGALLLGGVTDYSGDWILKHFFNSQVNTASWVKVENYMDSYGALALGLIALSPIPLQPAVVIAALAGMPLPRIFIATLLGRGVKFSIFAWLASHAPQVLMRFRKVRHEMEEIEVAARNGK